MRAVAPAAIIVLLMACAAQAESSTPSPEAKAAADLAAIRGKVAENRLLSRQLEQLVQIVKGNSGPAADAQNQAILLGNVARARGIGKLPIDIKAAQNGPLAQVRARLVSQILSADLNGDWSVSRDEVTTAAASQNDPNAAALFLTGDADADNVLTLEEIKLVVQAQAALEYAPTDVGSGLLDVFDFDGDGKFTEEEMTRTLAALATG